MAFKMKGYSYPGKSPAKHYTGWAHPHPHVTPGNPGHTFGEPGVHFSEHKEHFFPTKDWQTSQDSLKNWHDRRIKGVPSGVYGDFFEDAEKKIIKRVATENRKEKRRLKKQKEVDFDIEDFTITPPKK